MSFFSLGMINSLTLKPSLGIICVSDLCVWQVQVNSPGHQAGLEPFFDFIISICDTRLVSAP